MERYLVEKIKASEVKKGDRIIIGSDILEVTEIEKTDKSIKIKIHTNFIPFRDKKHLEETVIFRLVNAEKTIEHLENDNVNRPSHYTQSKHECIDIIEEITKQCATPFSGYLLGNIQKYIWRFMYKNGIEDLKKAKWYLEKLISNEEKELI